MNKIFLLFLILTPILSTNFTSIEETFLEDLLSHISLRARTKSSITRAVNDFLNPILNEQLFIESGNTATIIFENTGIETIQREQHDLIYAFLHPSIGPMIKFFLLRPSALNSFEGRIHRSSLNIFLVDNFESFLTIYDRLEDSNFENDAYYLIILNYLDDDWFKIAKKIFGKSLLRYMINTSLLFLSNSEDVVNIFTYFPFLEGRCENIEPVLIQKIIDGKWQNGTQTIFPNKLKNFHKCPIKVALLDIPPFIFLNKYKKFGQAMTNLEGIEANLLKVLAMKHNFTIEPVVVDEWGFVFKTTNRTANGAIEALMSNRANMTLGFFGISAERNTGLTPGFPYHKTSLIFVIPPEVAPISRLIKPLSETVRAAVFSIFCVGAGIVFISSQFKQRWRNLILGQDNRNPYSNMFLSGLGGSLVKTPMNNFARYCLISWILLCFMVNNFYLAKYFQFLAQDDEISLADTFEKIAQRKYTIYIRPTIKEFFDEHPELEAHVQILPLYKYPKVERSMQDPATTAVLMHTLDMILYKNKVMYKDKPLMVASQHLVDIQISIYYPNNTFLRHEFNPFLRTLTSNGLFAHWVKKYIDPMFLIQKMKAGHDEMVITNAHLADIYWVVVGGWLLAVMVFAVEMLSKKFGRLKYFFQ